MIRITTTKAELNWTYYTASWTAAEFEQWKEWVSNRFDKNNCQMREYWNFFYKALYETIKNISWERAVAIFKGDEPNVIQTYTFETTDDEGKVKTETFVIDFYDEMAQEMDNDAYESVPDYGDCLDAETTRIYERVEDNR